MTEPSEGTPVTDFTAPATGDQTVTLSDYRGKFVILYFYPRDNTPGCTQEGEAFRDHYDDFSSLNAVIFGISRDPMKTHEKFREKHEFPFALISDPEETLCQQFDVIKMKNMYGKQVRGIERSTFLIDPDGNLVHAWRKVKVKQHIPEVLEKLKEYSS